MNQIQNAVAQRNQQGSTNTIAGFIQQITPEIARALPMHMDADRMARIALTEVRKTPKLAQCTPESFAGALLTSAALGLEPGINGEAYLVPHGRECSLIIGYQGYVKLFHQSPLAKTIDAQAVYEADEFDYAYGTEQFLRHKPPLSGDRSKVIAYYAVATLNTGASAFVILTPEEVKALRGGKVGSSGGIADPMKWMERKTAIRQLVKMLPRSSNLNRAMEADETKGSTLRHRQLTRDQVRRELPAAEQPPAGVNPTTGEVDDDALTGQPIGGEVHYDEPEGDF